MDESKYYLVHGLSPFIDGLIVRGVSDGFKVEVDQVINRDINVGDRVVRLPVADFGMSISIAHLTQVDDPTTREFASDNPFGNQLGSISMSKDSIQLAMIRYDRAVTVTVIDGKQFKTLYSQNYVDDIDKVWEKILEEVHNGDSDELIFFLKELKESELNGKA